MRDIRLQRRFQGRHAQQPQVLDRAHLVTEPLIGRIVALVVADHQRDAGSLGRVDHFPPLGHREAHRLLDQHVFAGFGRGDGDR